MDINKIIMDIEKGKKSELRFQGLKSFEFFGGAMTASEWRSYLSAFHHVEIYAEDKIYDGEVITDFGHGLKQYERYAVSGNLDDGKGKHLRVSYVVTEERLTEKEAEELSFFCQCSACVSDKACCAICCGCLRGYNCRPSPQSVLDKARAFKKQQTPEFLQQRRAAMEKEKKRKEFRDAALVVFLILLLTICMYWTYDERKMEKQEQCMLDLLFAEKPNATFLECNAFSYVFLKLGQLVKLTVEFAVPPLKTINSL